MSELDLCSRREADRLLRDGRISVRGVPVAPVLGARVDRDETDISILPSDENDDSDAAEHCSPWSWWERVNTVVLRKPVGYVSGQPDPAHGHPPAVRLLTKNNYFAGDDDDDASLLDRFVFERWRPPPPRRRRAESAPPAVVVRVTRDRRTLSDYRVAGRLDLDSRGLLVLTRSGTIAKRLVAADSTIEKEYRVRVAPAPGTTTTTITRDLSVLLRADNVLVGDRRPLRPVVAAEWVGDLELRLVLREGRKRQIRRAVDELLGLRVTSLERVRIGPIRQDALPVGKWRPASERELRSIVAGDEEEE